MSLKLATKSISTKHTFLSQSKIDTRSKSKILPIRFLNLESKNTASLTLLLSLNLVFFAVVTATSSTPIPGSTASTYYPIAKCDPLNLGICANVLNLVDVVVGSPPTLPCCSLIEGIVDLEAALCLCTAIKANILGIKLNVPITLSLVLNNCGKEVPTGFECY